MKRPRFKFLVSFGIGLAEIVVEAATRGAAARKAAREIDFQLQSDGFGWFKDVTCKAIA